MDTPNERSEEKRLSELHTAEIEQNKVIEWLLENSNDNEHFEYYSSRLHELEHKIRALTEPRKTHTGLETISIISLV